MTGARIGAGVRRSSPATCSVSPISATPSAPASGRDHLAGRFLAAALDLGEVLRRDAGPARRLRQRLPLRRRRARSADRAPPATAVPGEGVPGEGIPEQRIPGETVPAGVRAGWDTPEHARPCLQRTDAAPAANSGFATGRVQARRKAVRPPRSPGRPWPASWAEVTSVASAVLRMLAHSMNTLGTVDRLVPARSSRGWMPLIPS